jgi:hypothetical protein
VNIKQVEKEGAFPLKRFFHKNPKKRRSAHETGN